MLAYARHGFEYAHRIIKSGDHRQDSVQEWNNPKEAALELGYLTDAEFDAWVIPETMIGPNLK